MTLAQLKYFVKVAQNGHLTQTAKELLIAQPSLTQAIKKLEEELGFSLFEKKGRVLFLTKEGKEFLPYAITVVESLHKAEQMQDLIYKRYTGNIRFAYTRPMSPNYIPNLIRGFFFKNENKKINIESYSAATAVIINDLKNDKIDFGFCSDSEVQDDEIKLIRLIEYPIKLVVNEKDPFRLELPDRRRSIYSRLWINSKTYRGFNGKISRILWKTVETYTGLYHSGNGIRTGRDRYCRGPAVYRHRSCRSK